MNESEIETELLRLRPRAPSPALEDRIATALQGALVPARSQVPAAAILLRPKETGWFRFLPNLGWALAGAAAGIALVVAFHPGTLKSSKAQNGEIAQARAGETAVFEPEESAREVVSAEAAEILYDEENEPAQVMRYSSVERYAWTNRATGARVEIEMPREDVLFVPVAYQ